MLPCVSPKICTSICRGARRTARGRRSRRRRPSALRAAPLRRRPAARPASRTMRMPRPPPPAEALTRMAGPSAAASCARSAADCLVTAMLGSTGTPESCMRRLASIFEPIAAIASGVGPMNVRPGLADAARKVSIFGEKAVARMYGVGAGQPGGIQQRIDVQIRLGARRTGQRHRLVRFAGRTAHRGPARNRRPRSRSPSRGRFA